MTDTNTNLTTIDTDTTLTNITSVELMARFEPEQQLQLSTIEHNIFLQERIRQTALELENHRSRNAWILANQEHQNKLSQTQYQADREDQREAMKAQSSATQAKQTHEHQLERMQVELQNHIALAETTTKLSIITTLMEEEGKVRTSMLARMKNSHEVLDEVFKMRDEAVIQEKLAQKQHHRELEKIRLASSLKQAEHYFQAICLRLSKLLDDSQEDKAKQEIAQLYAMWNKEENKDD